ncbi:G patch domain-containing protein 4-like [Ylistrum balloti]|uniref:G patch domain-containing protein 4-like n=1 Tax=Ylistrum balloti TaxID=509963 RepID=UPI002905A220|nr:G patch domain-containing protein 4-like [Ylistrum balloti]
MSSSKFALQQLSKHGWKEGSGLGKSESGIKEAIKVKIKHDTHGVGHKKGDEFAFHWWDHVFNKAASNISVNSTEDGVNLSKNKDSDKISTTTTKTFDNKAMLYGKFLKGATLSNGSYKATKEEDSEDEYEEDTTPARIQDLEDAELLKACGGMTGHKAARHGHKLNGKLARIQEQEALLLAKYKTGTSRGKDKIEDGHQNDEDLSTDVKEKKKKRKKDKSEKKKRKREMEDLDNSSVEATVDTDSACSPVKLRCEETSESVKDKDIKKKKRKEKMLKNIDITEVEVQEIDMSNSKTNKQTSDECVLEHDSTIRHLKKKKKKLKGESCEDDDTASTGSDRQDSVVVKKKKSKKQKKEKSCD